MNWKITIHRATRTVRASKLRPRLGRTVAEVSPSKNECQRKSQSHHKGMTCATEGKPDAIFALAELSANPHRPNQTTPAGAPFMGIRLHRRAALRTIGAYASPSMNRVSPRRHEGHEEMILPCESGGLSTF